MVNRGVSLDSNVLKLGVSDKSGRGARVADDESDSASDDDSEDVAAYSDEDRGCCEADDDEAEPDAEMVGEFGEGMKIGIAALAAEGYSVAITTNRQRWRWCVTFDWCLT